MEGKEILTYGNHTETLYSVDCQLCENMPEPLRYLITRISQQLKKSGNNLAVLLKIDFNVMLGEIVDDSQIEVLYSGPIDIVCSPVFISGLGMLKNDDYVLYIDSDAHFGVQKIAKNKKGNTNPMENPESKPRDMHMRNNKPVDLSDLDEVYKQIKGK